MTEIRGLLSFLWHHARWQLVGAIVFSALLSLTEGIGLAMIFPVISLLGAGSSTPAGPRTRLLFQLLAASHIPRSGWLAALLLIALISVAALTQLNGMLTTLTIGIILRTRERLGAEIFRGILHADWSFLTRRRSSDITHYLTGELPRIGTLIGSLIALLANAMVALLMLGVAFYLSPLLTAIVLGSFALLLPWQRRVGRALYRSGDEVSEKMRAVFNSSMDRLGNLKVVKAYGAQDAELSVFSTRYGAVVQELMEAEWRSVAASRRFQLFSLAMICVVILLGLGPMHLAAGTMLIFLFAFLRAAPRLSTVQGKLNEILAELPAFRQIRTFLKECAAQSEQGDPVAAAPSITHDLTLTGVTFAYTPDGRKVLEGIDLTLAAGQMTCVAGPSGAGKSTVADLIMGLLIPGQGTVAADGAPITRSNARAWRRQVGYVSQDTLLFHDSIRANLLWARPESTGAELEAALEAASATFVFGLAQGLDTVVGDRGMMLSHGQRQRIALARALLMQPTLLILDEATNSLDLENEENILKTVRARRPAVTTLLISHRPSAVRFADRVYVLAEGRITNAGGWEDVQAAVEATALVD